MRVVRLTWLVFSILLTVEIYADEHFSPYDIPDKRELESCSCVEKEPKDGYWTEDPFFVTLTVANYGDEPMNNVKVSLYPGTLCVVYLFETSQISRRSSFSQDYGWETVPDKYFQDGQIEEVFPFTNNFELAQKLLPCKDEDSDCENIMIRFQHYQHGACPKSYFAQFQAVISDDSGNSYKTNTGTPLRLSPGNPLDPECYIAPQDECGGHSFTRPEEVSDEDLETADSDAEKTDGCSLLFL